MLKSSRKLLCVFSFSSSLHWSWVHFFASVLSFTMFKWTLLRMMLLLWMSRETLQGGTGFSQQMGLPNGGIKGPSPGYGAQTITSNGQAAKPNGFPQNFGYPNGGTKGPNPGYSAQAGPQNEQKAKPNGYGGYPTSGGVKQSSNSSQFMGSPNAGTKGPRQDYGAKAGPSNGAKSNGFSRHSGYPNSESKGPNQGYGGHPNGGKANKPNTGASQFLGYPSGGFKGPRAGISAKAISNGHGSKASGYGGYPNGGTSNQQNAGNGGYGDATENQPNAGFSQNKGYPSTAMKGPQPGANPVNGNGGYPNGATANQQHTGSSQFKWYPSAGMKGPRAGYGAKAGASNVQGPNPNNGNPNSAAMNHPNAGSSPYKGNPNAGMKGPQAGYGGYPNGGTSNQQNAGNRGYPSGAAANQQNTGSPQFKGYPSAGMKGPQPGYGAKAGASNVQGAKQNSGYGGYPNGGAVNQPNPGSSQYTGNPNGGMKGPKAGYGAKAGGALSGQGAKPGHGYSNGGAANQLNKGNGAKAGGVLIGQGPKANNGYGGYLNGGGVNQLNKGYGAKAGASNGQGTRLNNGYGVPGQGDMSKGPFKAANSGYMPLTTGNSDVSGGKGQKGGVLNAEAPTQAPVVQTKGFAPLVEQLPNTGILPEQGTKPNQPFLHPTKGLVLPQSNFPNSMTPQLAPKPFLQGPQSYKPSKPYKRPTSAFHQNKGPKAVAPILPESTSVSESAYIPQTSQGLPLEQEQVLSHEQHPVMPQLVTPQESIPVKGQAKIQQNPTLPQKMYPTATNPECVPSGQWVKLPSSGSGYPNGKGQQSQQGFGQAMGGHPTQGMNKGYKAGHGNPFTNQGYNGQQYGPQTYNPKALGKYGQKGFQNGGQQRGIGHNAMPEKYGSPESLYNPETLSHGGDAKASKYDNRNLEPLHQGPEIDGQKAIDNFGEGEIPSHPDLPGTSEVITQSPEKFETGDFIEGKLQAEVVSFPAAPTVGPVITPFDTTLSVDGSSVVPASVPDASPILEVPISPMIPHPDLHTGMIQPATPQQIHIQQHLKLHIQPHGNPQSGKDGKYQLSGFFGNKYEGCFTSTYQYFQDDGYLVAEMRTSDTIRFSLMAFFTGPKLVDFKNSPPHLQFNKYVLTGYRPISTCRDCLRSLFYLHNESGNIYTHGVPFVCFLLFLPVSIPWADVDWWIGIVHYMACLSPTICSVFYHLFMNHMGGEPIYDSLLCFDMFGVCLVNTLGALPIIHITLLCHPFPHHVAMLAYLLLSGYGVYCAVTARSNVRRLKSFAWQAAFRFVLFMLRLIGPGRGSPSSLRLYLTMDALALFGGLVNISRLPERISPGLFDYWFNSHQIMHIMVILSIMYLHWGMLEDLRWLKGYQCLTE
ncbi:hypothetical protein DNTS_017795 [Danionella cerebrum]|uniref:Progestin and adipoQ receptor family member 4 n=1 Tax=Danionella cerebrum TaxID=2873325 RepID=A0A553NH32_9TELE|nr:hypothetical protein DNTS_017795 [Danionella translucida]